MMHAARLDRKVTIRRAVAGAPDPSNVSDVTWPDLVRVSANVEPVSDGERARAGETLASMKSRFTIRYSSLVAAVSPLDRLAYDGREYEINGVKEIGRRQYLEITATARAEAL